MLEFIIESESTECKARAGKLITSRGIVQTPFFMPVGTQGAVKAVSNRFLENCGFDVILANTYHLYLRPGMDVIEKFGGLHKFMKWNRSILTDSGGYQIFSLNELNEIKEEGVTFKSHIDGSKHFFSPEKVIEIQKCIGSDIMMVLDHCPSYPSEKDFIAYSLKLSQNWAERSKIAFTNIINQENQSLFGIAQGGMYKDLREQSINYLLELGFDGYAIGGLSVGEPSEIMYEICDFSTEIIPKNKPRYLMGVGTPENILNAIMLGVDMFDCVLPTRNARNGQLFTTRGKINIRNAKYKYDDSPIDENLDNYSSREYSLGYLRHLFMSGEIAALQIATEQNLAFYKWLVTEARKKIIENQFMLWKDNLIRNFVNYQNDV